MKAILRYLGIFTVLAILAWPYWVQAKIPQWRTYAVFKASYNLVEGKKRHVVGGVIGSAFFIDQQTAVTAKHVLNEISFRPPKGYSHSQVWLIHPEKGAIEINVSQLQVHSKLDATLLHFAKPTVTGDMVIPVAKALKTPTYIAQGAIWAHQNVVSEGFVGAAGKGIQLAWTGRKLTPKVVGPMAAVKSSGVVKAKKRIRLKARDVFIDDAPCFVSDLTTVVGMSGGPLIQNGEVVGINSFGFPAGKKIKTESWAVSIESLL